MKDSRYFQHDSDARNDVKMTALIKDYGMKGYGWFWVVIENMRASNNYKLPDKLYTINALAMQMLCENEEVLKFLENCIEAYELLTKEDGFIYSKALSRRMSNLDNIRDKRAMAAYQRWDKKANPEVKVFIDYWHTKYLAKFNEKYVFHGAKEGTLVKLMLNTLSLPELKKRADSFFESEDKFIMEAGYTIGVFNSQINKLDKHSKQEEKHGLPPLKRLG